MVSRTGETGVLWRRCRAQKGNPGSNLLIVRQPIEEDAMATLSIPNRFNPTFHRTAVALLLAIALLSVVAEAQLVQAAQTAALRSQSNNSPSNDRMDAGASNGLQFVPVSPCRVVDTRGPNGPFGGPPIQGGTSRSFPLPQGACDIPPSAG